MSVELIKAASIIVPKLVKIIPKAMSSTVNFAGQILIPGAVAAVKVTADLINDGKAGIEVQKIIKKINGYNEKIADIAIEKKLLFDNDLFNKEINDIKNNMKKLEEKKQELEKLKSESKTKAKIKNDKKVKKKEFKVSKNKNIKKSVKTKNSNNKKQTKKSQTKKIKAKKVNTKKSKPKTTSKKKK